MKQDTTLTELLQLSVPKPAHIANSDGAAVLALALHCLMVREGFTVERAPSETAAAASGTTGAGQRRRSSYAPQADWNGCFVDEWVFNYTKDGKANRFVLHCSLQAASKRMYVHSSEIGNLANVQVLGLLVDNYVPDVRKLKSNSWTGVLQQEAKLVEMFTSYITGPLSDGSEDIVLSGSEPSSPLQRSGTVGRAWALGGKASCLGGGAGSGWAMFAAGVALTAAVATAALYMRSGAARPRLRLIGLAGPL